MPSSLFQRGMHRGDYMAKQRQAASGAHATIGAPQSAIHFPGGTPPVAQNAPYRAGSLPILERPAVNNYTPITYQGHTFPGIPQGGPVMEKLAGGPGVTTSTFSPRPTKSELGLSEQYLGAMSGYAGQRPQLGPVAAQYGNTPLAGAPMVQPRYGQTLQDAQRSYESTMADATANTQRRVGEMFTDPGLGRRYEAVPQDPRTAGASLIGRMNASSGNVNQIIRRADGSTLIRGPVTASDWGEKPSTLPGAEGRTNAQMQAVRRENMRGAAQDRKASRAVGLANRAVRMGLASPSGPFAPAAYLGAKRMGVPLGGRGGYKPGVSGGETAASAAPKSVEEAVSGLQKFAESPLAKQFEFDAMNAKVPQWEELLQRPEIQDLGDADIKSLQDAVGLALTGGLGMKPGSDSQEFLNTFRSKGPKALRDLIERRKQQRTPSPFPYKPPAVSRF